MGSLAETDKAAGLPGTCLALPTLFNRPRWDQPVDAGPGPSPPPPSPKAAAAGLLVTTPCPR